MKNIVLCIFLFALSVLGGEEISRVYLLGQFDPKTDSLFAAIPEAYSAKESVQYLRKEALDAFCRMAEAAKKEGISLKVVSATRTFNAQKAIWEAKWSEGVYTHKKAHERAKYILRYSAMPGTSRHHWGTDVDINSIESEYFKTDQGKREFEWLTLNAKNFGFFRPYTAKGTKRPYGYEEEEWHWSYGPLSNDFTRAYAKTIRYEDIADFRGAEMAKSLQVITHYVLGVAPSREE